MDLHEWVALSLVPGAARHLRTLLDLRRDPSLRAVLAVAREPGDAGAFRRAAAGALRSGRHAGLTAVPFDDGRYPALLRVIADPPPVLWIRGRLDGLDAGPAVAVVGSRAASPASLRIAGDLGAELAAAGCLVVSGLARGCDAAAHRGALSAGGRTAAVLGCGADLVYPPEHDALAEAITGAGALVSELPPGMPPLAHNFPRRNRIISGLSQGVIVIEASERSGSLITAACALDQGRAVMAVPGLVSGGRNRGGHALLRDGARLVETAADVLEELGLAPPARSGTGCADPTGDPVLDAMASGEDVDVQHLAAATGLTVTALLGRLVELEVAGRVVRLPAGRFVRAAV